ncbi:protein transport protein Sec16A isoform X2 [Megalops cyprinoides]|uniref:protein transport protein Sec16A isoform X2 n=1 Tax=Megalops cyprinoides TaxID=118141 RepID=UPI001864814D|nr:protein transport protein Sec16A isoform X2 [Megalops cyprinoides]
MQPPPRTAPPGSSGPPPTGGIPNAFRRTRPHKQPGNTAMMAGPGMPVPPMTDPFAFGRQAMATGTHPPPPKSSPLPMQTPPPAGFLPNAQIQEQGVPPQPLEGGLGPHHVPPPSSLPGPTPVVNIFTPNSAMSSAPLPGQFPNPQNLKGSNPQSTEQGPSNLGENAPYITPGASLYGSDPMQNRPPFGQDSREDPAPYTPAAPSTVPSQPQTMPSPPASQWLPNHRSRPPSVQNYFQPTSDPPQYLTAPPPVPLPAPAPPPAPSPHLLQPAQSPHTPHQLPLQNQIHSGQQGLSGPHSTTPGSDTAGQQGLEGCAGTLQHQNSHFQGNFAQNCMTSDPWLSQPSQEHFYHQMGRGPGNRRPDSMNSQHSSPPAQGGTYIADPGTISMFFKGNDVENEETLSGERKAVNGVAGGTGQACSNPTFPNHQLPSPKPLPGAEVAQRGSVNVTGCSHAPPMGEGDALHMNDSGFVSGTPRHVGGQFDHVENLECIPNQEVLPSEPEKIPSVPQNTTEHLGPAQGSSAAHGGDHFEGGPNLETPDSVPRPIRSESVSSSYSNVSHGSASGSRRPQNMVATFIQQETAKPQEDSAAGYFEQIDTSPAGESGPHATSGRMYHTQLSQPPTPSPPKPTGIFQASANSSFEPVRSHGVGVRTAEVDQARMVMEKNSHGPHGMATMDISPGNLEQPPDNLENIFTPSPQHPDMGLQERRPSSRAHGARLMCESPATTLWAQNEMPILGANILLAPAAPPVHGPVKQLSTEVIQPPEDSPLNLQVPHQPQKPDNLLENLENPPKVSEGDLKNPQASLGYASLLVPSPAAESFQNQPVLIAPPTTNYSVISTNNPANTTHHMMPGEVIQNPGADGNTLPLHLPSVVFASNTVLPGPSKHSNLQQHFVAPPLNSSGTFSGASATNPGPLNLASESRHIMKPENSPLASTGRPLQADSAGSQSQSVLPVNSQAPPAAPSQKQPTNYELLDFTMHHPQSNQNQAPNLASHVPSVAPQQAPPPVQGAKPGIPANNTTGFYLQVTKEAQQGGRGESEPQAQQSAEAALLVAAGSQMPEAQPGLQGQGGAPLPSYNQAPLSNNQHPPPPPLGQGLPPAGAPPPAPAGPQPPQPWSSSQPPAADPHRPPSSLGSQQGYIGPTPMPGPGYGGYYGGAYPEYPDGRPPYASPYYQDPYRRYDPRYSRHEGPNPSYREGERYHYREQPERPSSRSSQYSDRPSSRQGYSEDFSRANRSAYNDYYADSYKKPYDYGDRSRWEHYDAAAYDPRYRSYYDPSYWYYNPEAYGGRDPYYGQQYSSRGMGYDDWWRYDPRYDASFDEESRRQPEHYGDDFDRRSVHSEQSAHSVRSSRSQHSHRSSFSSRSQQSQMCRSQPDLISAGYEPPGQNSSLMVHYPYPDADASRTFTDFAYQTGYSSEQWPAAEQVPLRPMTPEKYSVPHRCARFGPGGQLIQVLPNLPSAGQPALVEIHGMETMLQDSQEQQELRTFPGPLVKGETHKVDVIKFAQNKSLECLRNDSLIDKDSACLIWEFIVLLCRQNGTVVGTDIADLLLREHRSVWLPGKSPNEANLIDFNNEPIERAEEEPGLGTLSLLSDTFMTIPENIGKETERFRELLLFGRKKDALESAMKNGLWGHALLLASKMDNRTHARVMTRFANSLPINDPLQTVYQLMSGRMPAAATCCGDEKWGDWRPHLAMVLSNLTHTLDLDTRTITTMGDTLASKGLIDAAHFCYMMAQVGLGVYTKKSTKMVLIGANHSLSFFKFASNEAIQRTEAYEYAQSLGSQPCSLPNFQVFKFIYACRLAEVGLSAQAFHYCEVVSRALLSFPSYHSPVFISQLIQMSAKLRFFDPQLKEKPEQELFIEPDWLLQLRQLDGQIRDGVISYSVDRATPQQYVCSTPSSEFDQTSPQDPMGMPQDIGGPAPENPLMSSLMPNPGPPLPGVQLMPPAPTTMLENGVLTMPQVLPTEGVPFYPVPPSQPALMTGPVPIPDGQAPVFPPPGLSYAPSYQPEQSEMYPAPPVASQMPPQMPPVEPLPAPPEQQQLHGSQPSSPTRNAFTPQMDFYDQMAHMTNAGPGRRSRTTSQSSVHTVPGRRSRTTSESSTHSTGRERSNSVVKQSSPPPPAIPEKPTRREEPKTQKKDSPKKSQGGRGGWLNWLYRKGKNEAHLPDDKNKSIVWDENKQRWINLDEPEEENKPPPPPPSNFPKMSPQMGPGGPPGGGPPGGGPPVNMFSRKAGTKARYVDVLNPGGTGTKPASLAPAPAHLFGPLAPMPIPANLFVPGAATDEQQPTEGNVPEAGENPEQGHPASSVAPQMFNPTLYPPGPEGAPVMDGTQSGELSRSSSMSSLSREVSQHLNQVPTQPPAQGGPPTGGVTFYNPSQFTQPSAPTGTGRPGRFGQRKYPTLK